jgi:hypothetical protein
VTAVSIPGVAIRREATGSENRYNAFDVAVLDVPGAQDWSLIFGSAQHGGDLHAGRELALRHR